MHYVADDDPHRNEGDLRFEPKKALAGGPRGLDFLWHIAWSAAFRLVPGGWLLMEYGYDQRDAYETLLRINDYRDIRYFLPISRAFRR